MSNKELFISTYLDKIAEKFNITKGQVFEISSKGLFGTFRNPTAHAPKIEWNLEEQDALDLFTLASYVLRRIDNSHP